jgi:L-iditol 2-dehydrogenase
MPKMLAAVATALGRVRCEEVAVPEPTPGKVLVRTRLASICGSDLHIVYMGWNANEFPLPPGHPGHEGVGEVVDGGGTSFSPGDLVLTAPNIWLSRAFAEYQLIEPQYVLRLPNSPPMSHMLMAQQLGTVVYGCRLLPPLLGQTVVVIGQGSVGLFHDFMLRRLGAHRIIAIEPVAERLAAGRDLFGVDEAIDVTGQRATEAVLDLTQGSGADVVIEAVGSVETLNQALKLARPQGRVAAFGLPTTMEPVPFDWDTFFRKRLSIHTVHGAQEEPGLPDFQLAVDFIARGEIDVSPFVSHRFAVSSVQDAFDLAHSKEKGALKVTLTF